MVTVGCLNSGTGDKEPLVDSRVNGGWWEVLVSRDWGGVDAVRVVEGGVCPGDGLLDL